MGEKKISRREFLEKGLAIGFGVVGLGVLSVCDAKTITVKKKKIINLDKINNNQMVNFIYKNKKGILVKTNNKFYAYYNLCTHKGGPLEVQSSDVFRCKWHGATFNISNGNHISGPGSGTLTKIPITIKNKAVYISD